MKKEEMDFLKKISFYAIGSIVVVISLLFDKQIFSSVFFNRNEALDPFFIFITYIGSLMSVVLILLIIYLWKSRKKDLIMPLFSGMFVAFIITYILKLVINRARPYVALNFVPIVSHLSSQSFPSMHATLVFAVLPILLKITKENKICWIMLACFIAISRVFLGVHYMSDVVMGAMIGYFSMSFVLSQKKLFRRIKFR